MYPIIVLDLVHDQSFLEVNHKQLEVLFRYKPASMNRVDRETDPFFMPACEVGEELGESASVLLESRVVEKMVQARVVLDQFKHGGRDLKDFVIPPDFFLHSELTTVLMRGLFDLLSYLKFLGFVLDHDHIPQLLKHVDHFSQSVDFKFAHLLYRRNAMRVESVEDFISDRIVTMNLDKRFTGPLSLRRARYMSHEHSKVLFELIHIRVLACEKRAQSFIVHYFRKYFVDENFNSLFSPQLFKYSPWQTTLDL